MQTYLDLDLSRRGQIATDLREAVSSERGEEIETTPHTGHMPGDLTPRMRSWYDRHIAGPRQLALSAIYRQLRDTDVGDSESDAVLYDLEAARIERKYLSELDKLEGRRKDKDLRAVQESERELARADRLFREKEASLNRPPKMVNPLIYWGGIFVIGLAEMAINWESFNKVGGFTPAIATGVTVVVAIALAMSSHFIGTAFRHISHDMDDSQSDYDRWAKVKMFSFGFLALSFVLAVVAYSRINFLSAEMVKAAALGGAKALNPVMMIGGSMISNMIVWIVGVLFAYILHDADPAYPEAKIALDKARAKLTDIQERMDKAEQGDRRKIEANFKNELRAAENASNFCADRSNVAKADAMLKRLKAKDREFISLLDDARNTITSADWARRARFIRKRHLENALRSSAVLSVNSYAGVVFQPKYLEK